MGDGKLHRYETDDVVVTWNAGVCIHAAECVRGLPAVFDPNAKPWVRPEAARPDDLAATIARCPSGALGFVRKAGVVPSASTGETVSTLSNVATIKANGPYMCNGEFAVGTAEARTDFTLVLCRCGASGNKPYCDGSHAKKGFQDAGLLPAAAPSASGGAGKVTVTPLADGPLKCVGPFVLAGTDGRTTSADPAFLCRCGHSQNKPFCDGSHKKVGFKG